MNVPGGPLIKDEQSSSRSDLTQGEVELPQIEDINVDIEPEGDDGKTEFIQCCTRIKNKKCITTIKCIIYIFIVLSLLTPVICCYVFVAKKLAREEDKCNYLKSNVKHVGIFKEDNDNYYLEEPKSNIICNISFADYPKFLGGKKLGNLYNFYTPIKPTRCTIEEEDSFPCKRDLYLFMLLYSLFGIIATITFTYLILKYIIFYPFKTFIRFRLLFNKYHHENIDGNYVVREKN
jgi:hypothetical protein